MRLACGDYAYGPQRLPGIAHGDIGIAAVTGQACGGADVCARNGEAIEGRRGGAVCAGGSHAAEKDTDGVHHLNDLCVHRCHTGLSIQDS